MQVTKKLLSDKSAHNSGWMSLKYSEVSAERDSDPNLYTELGSGYKLCELIFFESGSAETSEFVHTDLRGSGSQTL